MDVPILHHGCFLKIFFDFFRPYHYLFYKIYPKELKYISKYDVRLDNFSHQNWFIEAPNI